MSLNFIVYLLDVCATLYTVLSLTERDNMLKWKHNFQQGLTMLSCVVSTGDDFENRSISEALIFMYMFIH